MVSVVPSWVKTVAGEVFKEVVSAEATATRAAVAARVEKCIRTRDNKTSV